MRKSLWAAAAALGIAGGAVAADFSQVDKDKNGLVSFQEMQAVMPNVTMDEFSAYDGNADGQLSENEFAIWQAAHEKAAPSTSQEPGSRAISPSTSPPTKQPHSPHTAPPPPPD
jgi:hypothetical protein